MRPGRFHPGNPASTVLNLSDRASFNEAGAFPPRKLGVCGAIIAAYIGFNEAGAFPPRKFLHAGRLRCPFLELQ